CLITGLCSKKPCSFQKRCLTGNKGAATRGGNDLVAVERKDSHQPEGSGLTIVISRAQRFGSILDQWNLVFIADREYFFNFRWHPVEMDEDYSLGFIPGFLDTIFNRFAEECRVHIPGLSFRIYKN